MRPELMRIDNHIFERHLSIDDKIQGPPGCLDFELFDAFLTDPPYSIRAGAKKSGKKGGVQYTIDSDKREGHIPSTQSYAVEEVMLDLLHNSAKLLKV